MDLNGDRYQGQWKNDSKERGTQTYANGDKYHGPFINNLRHGVGQCVLDNGDQYDGQWVDDHMVSMQAFVETCVALEGMSG